MNKYLFFNENSFWRKITEKPSRVSLMSRITHWIMKSNFAASKQIKKQEILFGETSTFMNSWNSFYFLFLLFIRLLSRSSHPEAFFGKRYSENMQQIYRRTLMPKYDFNKVALQLFWNCNSTRVFSFKFAAYFQNTFSQELLWMAGSTLMKRKWSLWDLGPTNDILRIAVSFEILEIKFHGKWFWNRVL